MPVARDVDAPAHPHPVVVADVVDEAGEGCGPARPAGQPAVQPHRHHPGRLRPFLVEDVEAVPEVGEELVARVEPLRGREPHVVGIEGVRDDEVGAAMFRVPVRQLVGIGVRVVKEAAFLDHETPGVGAVPARVPAEGALAGDPGLDLDRLPEMLAFGVDVEILVVDPAIAVARDLPSRLVHRGHRLGVALESHRDPVHGDRHVARGEDAVQAPEPRPAAVLVERLHVHVALAGEGPGAQDLGEEGLRRGVAVEDAVLRPFLVVDDELDGDPRVVRPLGLRRVAAVSVQVSGVGIAHRRAACRSGREVCAVMVHARTTRACAPLAGGSVARPR